MLLDFYKAVLPEYGNYCLLILPEQLMRKIFASLVPMKSHELDQFELASY